MGISVYGPEGGVPGWWRAALRNAIGVLVFLWPIDAVLLLRRGHRQRLGDLAVRATIRRGSTRPPFFWRPRPACAGAAAISSAASKTDARGRSAGRPALTPPPPRPSRPVPP